VRVFEVKEEEKETKPQRRIIGFMLSQLGLQEGGGNGTK